jgi:MFS family permease
MRRMLTAFGYRDFRVLWFGSFTSSIGTWMQSVAENWLVLSLTGSAFLLGLDAFLQQLPILLFTLLGGVLADRLDRRRTLLVSQYIQMSCAFTLTALVYFGVVHVWHILLLSFLTGIAQSFGGPASQALIPSLVAKNDLPNAIALNSIQFNLARVIGPLLAGVALSAFGMAFCFSLNGLSFLVVIVALMSLRVKHIPPASPKRLGFAVLTFLPLFAQRVFHQGVGAYSRLMAFSGAGAVVGALVVAWLGRFKRMGLTVLVVQALCGVVIVAFALSRVLWLSDILLFFFGAALIVVFSTITSLVQLIAPDELRGRVMSIYMVAFRGGMPLGSLAGGYFASLFGAPVVLVVNGMVLVGVATYFLVRSHGVREL